jgi:hypothetical protein
MRLGQALHEAGDADLVDHLGQLPGAAGAQQGDRGEKAMRHRLHALEGRRVAAAHDGEQRR